MSKVKVLIVDDSELIRQVLTEIISSSTDLEVVGTAEHPYEARELIKQLNPDVITLDIEMPKMDGISFLKNLMRLRPMPVVMISTLTSRGARATLDALEIGAVDYVEKPSGGGWMELQGYAELINSKIRLAAKANVGTRGVAIRSKESDAADVNKKRQFHTAKVITIGSSTGGTEALKEVLSGMPKNCPPILMTQHIPEAFSATFAQRLNDACEINVCEAKSGMPLEQGCAYLAPGNLHMKVRVKDNRKIIALFDGEPVSGHIPSVDVMFSSVASIAGKHTVAAILTGMGADGAKGMKEIYDIGGKTIAQDESTSVVWGMPGAAVKMNAVHKVLPLSRIRNSLLDACEHK